MNACFDSSSSWRWRIFFCVFSRNLLTDCCAALSARPEVANESLVASVLTLSWNWTAKSNARSHNISLVLLTFLLGETDKSSVYGGDRGSSLAKSISSSSSSIPSNVPTRSSRSLLNAESIARVSSFTTPIVVPIIWGQCSFILLSALSKICFSRLCSFSFCNTISTLSSFSFSNSILSFIESVNSFVKTMTCGEIFLSTSSGIFGLRSLLAATAMSSCSFKSLCNFKSVWVAPMLQSTFSFSICFVSALTCRTASSIALLYKISGPWLPSIWWSLASRSPILLRSFRPLKTTILLASFGTRSPVGMGSMPWNLQESCIALKYSASDMLAGFSDHKWDFSAHFAEKGTIPSTGTSTPRLSFRYFCTYPGTSCGRMEYLSPCASSW